MNDEGKIFRRSIGKVLATAAPNLKLHRRARSTLEKTLRVFNDRLIERVKCVQRSQAKRAEKVKVKDVQDILKQLLPQQIATVASTEGLRAVNMFKNKQLVFTVKRRAPKRTASRANILDEMEKGVSAIMKMKSRGSASFDASARSACAQVLHELVQNVAVKARLHSGGNAINLQGMKTAVDELLGQRLSAFVREEASRMLDCYENGQLRVPWTMRRGKQLAEKRPRLSVSERAEVLIAETRTTSINRSLRKSSSVTSLKPRSETVIAPPTCRRAPVKSCGIQTGSA